MKLWRPPLLLWRYIGFEIIAIFLVALFAQTIISLGIISFQIVQHDGLRLAFIWPLLFKISIYSLYFTIPISLLFAVTLGFGRMIGDLEIIALKSSGVSYLQLMTPVMIFSLLCTITTLFLNNNVIPEVHYARRNLNLVLLEQLTHLGSGGEYRSTLPDDQGEIYCQRYYGNTMENVRLDMWTLNNRGGGKEERDTKKIPTTISAEHAKFSKSTTPEGDPQLIVDLYNLDVQIPDKQLRKGGDPHFLQKISTGHYQKTFPLTESRRGNADKKTYTLKKEIADNIIALKKLKSKINNETNLEQRKSMEKDIAALEDDIWSDSIEISRRLAFAFSCFTFLWAAIPLTLWLNHKNRLVPFFAGNLLAVGIFYPLVTLGMMLGKKGFTPLLAQSGNIILLILGGVIIWRVQKR